MLPGNISSKYYNITAKLFGFCGSLPPYLFFKTIFLHFCLSCSKGNMIFDLDYASFQIPKIVLLWKIRCDPSRAYSIEKWSEYLTINWCTDKNTTSYLSHDINYSFSGMIACLITSGLHFIAWSIWQESHFGYGQFGVDLNLFKTKGEITVLNTINTCSFQ